MQKGSPLGGAPATPTVKQVKRAFAAYIKHLNAHPDALSGCFKDEAGALDDRAHEAARAAIRELRAAWQPLKPSTSAPGHRPARGQQRPRVLGAVAKPLAGGAAVY